MTFYTYDTKDFKIIRNFRWYNKARDSIKLCLMEKRGVKKSQSNKHVFQMCLLFDSVEYPW